MIAANPPSCCKTARVPDLRHTNDNCDTDVSARLDKIHSSSCLMNAAGCRCTTAEELDALSEADGCGWVVCKSGTRFAQLGNPMPRLHLEKDGSINSMGLPNPGFEFYALYAARRHHSEKPVIQSISPREPDEIKTMLRAIAKRTPSTRRMMIEVNLSCPNLAKDGDVFQETGLLRDYIEEIRDATTSNMTIGLKLPPFSRLSDVDHVSLIVLRYYPAVKFVTCCNSLPNGLMIDRDSERTMIHPKDGLGGIGGSYCKPLALANVWSFYNRLGGLISIIACGGVASGGDAFDYLLCGATAVQIGTHLLQTNVKCFARIRDELISIMHNKGYKSIDDFRGRLVVATPRPPPTLETTIRSRL
jgi:dihydroorotate dehydrogenase (fumarate)